MELKKIKLSELEYQKKGSELVIQSVHSVHENIEMTLDLDSSSNQVAEPTICSASESSLSSFSQLETNNNAKQNLRKKSLSTAPLEMKSCHVSLEKLDLLYVKSDTESEEDSTPAVNSNETSSPSPQKPSKRMKVSSPHKTVRN